MMVIDHLPGDLRSYSRVLDHMGHADGVGSVVRLAVDDRWHYVDARGHVCSDSFDRADEVAVPS